MLGKPFNEGGPRSVREHRAEGLDPHLNRAGDGPDAQHFTSIRIGDPVTGRMNAAGQDLLGRAECYLGYRPDDARGAR
jgi:hypothetical protein